MWTNFVVLVNKFVEGMEGVSMLLVCMEPHLKFSIGLRMLIFAQYMFYTFFTAVILE